MATIKRRTTRKGEVRYLVQVRLRGYPVQARTFERKTDAKAWAQEVEAGIRAGRHLGLVDRGKHTLAELIDEYVSGVLPGKPAVEALYARHLCWWRKELGSYYLANLSSDLVEQCYRKLLREPGDTNRKRSPTTANRYLISLSSCLSYGRKKLKWLGHNPISNVEKEAEPRGRVRFLSRPVDEENSELERLLTACKASQNEDLYDLVVLGIWTGCREGELMALRRSWIHMPEGGFTVPASVAKTNRDRFVPLVGSALEIVERRLKGSEILFPGNFPRTAWNTALRKAGIEDFRFHDLRHTHASYLAMCGSTERELMDALGHATPAMAARYSHLASEHKRRVANRVGEAFRGLS